MKKKFLILGVCILAVFITACNRIPTLKNGEEVVARIDGQDYTAEDLYKELKNKYGQDTLLGLIDKHIAHKEIPTTAEIEAYVQSVFEYYKVYAETYEMEFIPFLEYIGLTGIKTEQEFLDYVLDDYKISLAIRKQIGTTFTDKDIERYYNEKYSEQITVRHILIEIDKEDKDDVAALKKANELIAELKDADKLEEKFTELAKEHSDDGSADNGGLIENFMKGSVVKEFWDASYKLKDGEYTLSAVKTEFGYHIIYRKSIKAQPKLEDSKDAIIDSLTTDIINEDEYAQYAAMAELRKKYNINIYDTDIKKTYEELLNLIEQTQQ